MQIHSLSDVQSKNIGANTVIWQYCVILQGAVIGENCNVCSHCFIENKVRIGDRVTIKNGVYIYDSIEIEDDVFIGPGVVFTNDIYPKSCRFEKKDLNYPKTRVLKGASIGGGAVILPGITIGEEAFIGAGSIVTKDVEPGAVVYGEKAKLRRLVHSL